MTLKGGTASPPSHSSTKVRPPGPVSQFNIPILPHLVQPLYIICVTSTEHGDWEDTNVQAVIVPSEDPRVVRVHL
jgi:hypothetical protein